VYGRVYIATGGRGVIIGNVVNAAPTVAARAAGSSAPVTGITTALSVLGADDNGEANLVYTWSAVAGDRAAVIFSANTSNAAKNTVATFSQAGTYAFLVTITDASGATATSSVNIVVNQTVTTLTVTPNAASILPSSTEQLTATAFDQFGNPIATPPTFTWSIISGNGQISTSGLYTAPAQPTVADIQVAIGSVARFAAIAVALPLLGDANLDGHVDATDLAIVLSNLGSVTSAWTDGNFDGASTIDLTELNDVLNNLGQSAALPPAPAAVVPKATSAPTTSAPLRQSRRAKKCPPRTIMGHSSTPTVSHSTFSANDKPQRLTSTEFPVY
jgi:hypothetical protein